MATPRLTADFWQINQGMPFVPYNRSLGRLDGLCQATVINETTNDPPDPIVDGAQYIIGTGTGAWTGHDLAIAYGYQKQWLITTPIEGFLVFNQATNKFRYFDGAAWQDLPGGGGSGTVTEVSGILGIVATPEPITTTGTVEIDQAITFWTIDDETAKIAGAVMVLEGTGITFDYSTPGEVTINGSASGQVDIQWQDEGSNLGTAGTVDTVDFVGPNVVASRSSDTVTITVTAGAGIPINTQTGNYTLVLGDAGYCIYRSTGSAATWTIPADGSVAFPVGSVVMFDNRDADTDITLAITTDTLVYTPGGATGSRTLLANSGRAFAHKVETTVWHVSGTGIY